jgi:NADH-quinone oxidoreductase subunit D
MNEFLVAQLHASYIRPGSVSQDIHLGFLKDILVFCESLSVCLQEIEGLLTENRIWKQRLVDIGVLIRGFGYSLGLTFYQPLGFL